MMRVVIVKVICITTSKNVKFLPSRMDLLADTDCCYHSLQQDSGCETTNMETMEPVYCMVCPTIGLTELLKD